MFAFRIPDRQRESTNGSTRSATRQRPSGSALLAICRYHHPMSRTERPDEQRIFGPHHPEPAGYRLLQAHHDAGGPASLPQCGSGMGLSQPLRRRPEPLPERDPPPDRSAGRAADVRRGTGLPRARPLYAARLHPLSRAVPLRSPLPAGGRRGRRAGDVPARALAACDPVRSTAAGHRQRGAQPRALCAGDAGTGGRQAGRKVRLAAQPGDCRGAGQLHPG